MVLPDKLMEPHAGPKQSEPKSGMAGIISHLLYQAHMTRDQVIKTAWFISKSREWLVARGWELVDRKMEESIGTLMGFRYKLKSTYPE